MESSEVKRSASPAASSEVDHRDIDVGKAADDDCSSKKPPKPEATQAPLNQEMERCPSGYRIPASVFERNKSSTQGDWSVASNESLFSIHMGNMSFTNDYYTWRSGELGPPTSDHMFCYSEHSSTGGAADMRSRELGLAEATMLEVIKENEGRSPEVRNARRSAGSNHSNMSFAFSVARGDTERIPSSTKSTAAAVVAAAAEAEAEAEAEAAENNAAEAEHDEAKEKEKGAQHRSNWLFCCPCWSFCS